MTAALRFSIILPVIDEGATIGATLDDLHRRWPDAETVIVDGGSTDDTAAIVRTFASQLLISERGRARQMNAGAGAASGDILVFLHGDSQLPDGALEAIASALDGREIGWGRFDIAIDGRHKLLPLVAATMNFRSRITSVATGDQAIFVTRAALDAVGGFPDIPLMEDIGLSKRLRRLAKPVCLRERVVTSGRRWDANGLVRTVLTMWTLRLGYFVGVAPERLAKAYARLKSR